MNDNNSVNIMGDTRLLLGLFIKEMAMKVTMMMMTMTDNNMYLLTELGRGGRENIWPEVMTCGPLTKF